MERPEVAEKTQPSVELTENFAVGNYARFPVAFTHGEGRYLWDEDGRRYLDFFSGLGVSCLGHGHPALLEAITEQAGKLLHTSNLYSHAPGAELARRLCELSFADRVFLCNSGTEAIEAAIKMARRAKPDRHEIVTAFGSFHGRTMGSLAATGQPALREGFGPMPPGFVHVEYGDPAAVAAAVNPGTAAVLVEPILGESGVVLPPPGYLAELRSICDREGLLLLLDEVQTGMGRTGTLFACEGEEVKPDILATAKGLAGGLPVGAVLATEQAAAALLPGSHGSTFGGNPVASAAALAVLDSFNKEGVLKNCQETGEYLAAGLRRLFEGHPDVVEVRGRGLMLGVEFSSPTAPLVAAALELGLLVNAAAGTVLRLLPPLTLTREEADEGLDLLETALKKVS
ncbi:MAG: acetylornithine transaminase [Proteobacteria bacterium]|nr:acetylornithine transaminase [Pseudomonadota bacterium]